MNARRRGRHPLRRRGRDEVMEQPERVPPLLVDVSPVVEEALEVIALGAGARPGQLGGGRQGAFLVEGCLGALDQSSRRAGPITPHSTARATSP